MSIDEKTQEGYDGRFDESGIKLFKLENIPPGVVNRYDARFEYYEISSLNSFGVTPELANSYPPAYHGYDIMHFHTLNCTPEFVRQHDGHFSWDIILSNKLKEPPEKINKLMKNINGTWGCKGSKERFDSGRVEYWGTGCKGIAIAFFDSGISIKIGHGLEHEHLMLNMARAEPYTYYNKYYNDDNLDAIVMYLYGWSIYDMMHKEGRLGPFCEAKPLPLKDVMRYSADIMAQLAGMGKKSMSHRDIRPANIIINGEDDRAYIIDFGNATAEKNPGPRGNRAYGGPNDIVSLGQVMYKMATGKHLFAKSASMERTVYADKIKDHRDWVYENRSRLRNYLNKVDRTIEHEGIREIIKACLTAWPDDHERIAGMFRKYPS